MKRSQELKANLVARGYKESLIDPQIQRAARFSREATLQPRPRRTPLNRVPLVTTYHPGLTSLARITKKHLPIFHTSQRLKQALPNPPLVAFRRPKNLRDLLVRANLQTPAPPTNTGNIACGNKRCKTCSVINNNSTFKSHATGREHKIRAHITCGAQYVGETENPLHIRMNGHRSDIRTNKTEKPLAAHFCQPDHSIDDLEVRGIEKIRDHGSTQWRKHRESYWIFQLRTLTPNGINLDEWVTTVPWRCQACLQQRTSYDTLD